MGRKKKKPMKPWCWYCNREFDDEKILIQHQKAKHFKCHICYKKLYTGPGLAIHCMQVHKENIDKVPNALPGRQDIEIEIYGMEGIPDKDLAEHAAKANEQKRKEREIEQGGDAEDTPSSSAPVPQMGATPGMPPGVMGMQQRMPGMPPQPGMMPGMPPMMPGMPMPPGMPPGMRMPPFPMPPMGMPGMPPMPPGMFPPRPGMPGARMPVSTAGMPTSSQGGMPFGAGPGGAPTRHGGHGQQPKPLFPSAAPPSTAGSGPVGADFRPLSSQSGSSGGNRPPAIGPIKPTFPSAEYSSSPKNTSSGASTSKTSSQSSDDRSGSSSKPSSAASSVTKSGPSTSSTSKIVHPDEELSLEELRAQMSKYKKAAPPQVPAAARGPAPLPPVPGIGVPPTSQPRMPGNAPQVSVGLASRIQTPGVMGMQPQGQMAPRMGMPAHGAMQMNGQRMHQFPMGQGMMPGYGMPAMPGFPGAPHPGMMGGMPQRMPPQMGDHARMMQGGRY